ncbi:MAG: fibrobacter succinogenes major paralogous domain-containing protein [Cryomorphaceae bacterium]
MNIRKIKTLFFFILFVALFTACSDDDENPAGTGAPDVVTFPANKISQFKAEGGGSVLSEGNSPITARGLVWSDAPGVTLANASASTNQVDPTGSFLTTIDRKSETEMFLDSNTTYYTRAYAVNDQGVGYGDELSFTTMETFYIEGEPLTDVEGNVYRTVEMEKEGMTWMAENLKVTSYNNGDPIPFIPDTEAWLEDSLGAYCYWENDPSFVPDYGNLYKLTVVQDLRGLCPTGWHVPTNSDWNQLRDHVENYSTSTADISVQLREEGDEFWVAESESANNFSGFSARGGGYRRNDDGFGEFLFFGQLAVFWCSTPFTDFSGNEGGISFGIGNLSGAGLTASGNLDFVGLSVRCIKDE